METSPLSGKFAQHHLQPPFIKPFENIALAFSGGGFRAASFSLGVLSYLNRLQFEDDQDTLKGHTVLQQVTYLSSASGGTIATTLYALCNAQGENFGKFYVRSLDALNGEQILEDALKILSDSKCWDDRPDKRRNLINAFAMAYDEFIFNKASLESLYYNNSAIGHLQEVCFNTTEFYTGESFRQDKKMIADAAADKYYKYGNETIYLDQDVAKWLKLGDILAASSCFPGGFEPIVFPDDFTHDGVSEQSLKNGLTMKPQRGDKEEVEFTNEKKFGLMDGGITDNQGLQSMMYADGRRIRRETTFEPFDLMMVNDVDSFYMRPYVVPKAPKNKGISLWGINVLVIALFLVLLATIISGIVYKCSALTIAGSILITFPLIFMAIVVVLYVKISGVSKSSFLKKVFTSSIVAMLIRYFTRTSVLVLKQILTTRLKSVLLLNMSIFMKRIRQLIYDRFYGSKQWINRGKGNHIYDLSFSNNINRGDSGSLNPSREIQIVAENAFDMATTLWYDKKDADQQHTDACVVACGQFTTCYNLLDYINKLMTAHAIKPAYDSAYQARLDNLKQQLLRDYELFKADPFFLYNESGKAYQVKNFKPVMMSEIPFPKNW